jgi:hypothetical protein
MNPLLLQNDEHDDKNKNSTSFVFDAKSKISYIKVKKEKPKNVDMTISD